MASEPIRQILTHFMRLGFKVEQEGPYFVASMYEGTAEFLLFPFSEYIQIACAFPLNDKAIKNKLDTLERLNAFNGAALISRATLVEEDSITFSAFFPNFYKPKLFATFFDTYLMTLE